MQTPEQREFTPSNGTEREIQWKGLEADLKSYVNNYFVDHGYGTLMIDVSSFDPDTVLPSSRTIKIKVQDPSNPDLKFDKIFSEYTPNDVQEMERILGESLAEKFPTIN